MSTRAGVQPGGRYESRTSSECPMGVSGDKTLWPSSAGFQSTSAGLVTIRVVASTWTSWSGTHFWWWHYRCRLNSHPWLLLLSKAFLCSCTCLAVIWVTLSSSLFLSSITPLHSLGHPFLFCGPEVPLDRNLLINMFVCFPSSKHHIPWWMFHFTI